MTTAGCLLSGLPPGTVREGNKSHKECKTERSMEKKGTVFKAIAVVSYMNSVKVCIVDHDIFTHDHHSLLQIVVGLT